MESRGRDWDQALEFQGLKSHGVAGYGLLWNDMTDSDVNVHNESLCLLLFRCIP